MRILFFTTMSVCLLISVLWGCGQDSETTKSSSDAYSLTVDHVSRLTWQETITLTGRVKEGSIVYISTDTEASDGFATVVGTDWIYTITGLVCGENKIKISANFINEQTTAVSIGEQTTNSNRALESVVTTNLSEFADIYLNIERFDVPMSVSSGTEIVAHRGASMEAPENTVASVNLAWLQGADGVEVDVMLSRDNRLMVIHDNNTLRVSGVNLLVADSLAADLRKIDVGVLRGSQFAGEKIPFLEEIISILPPGKKLYIDLKAGKEIVPFLVTVIQRSNKTNQICIQSNDIQVLKDIKNYLPSLTLFLVHNNISIIRQLTSTSVNVIDGFSLPHDIVTSDVVSMIKGWGFYLTVWTVNESTIAVRMKSEGVNAIFTDQPDMVLKAVSN
ncbi:MULTISPECIES: glycerophosphodiester phosphodiesterase [Geobacter]|uniref:glycerophosphodiester phosphodiesterase n=1 Tax=Geobacter TaxID=28231 RepID=UPI0020B76988|nr:glycerophosphodiester phosphodiesterase family protein [Geobacter sulfurreducens]UTG91320.1 hypothetical protein J8622_09745 [Geobacter sulfurreducens]BEH10147.1 hypothetical protein GSUET_17590 [Geobacter sulfurreducens subsp. ethanolicus]BET58266.1 hypothetical protein GEO60473_13060 [Geobacter sp. 60473]